MQPFHPLPTFEPREGSLHDDFDRPRHAKEQQFGQIARS
jgi:hypothetical protein